MKPLKGDQQLRSVSLSYSVALQALKPKSSPRRRRGLDASTDRGLTERSGEVFSLDILSHRISDMAIFRQRCGIISASPTGDSVAPSGSLPSSRLFRPCFLRSSALLLFGAWRPRCHVRLLIRREVRAQVFDEGISIGGTNHGAPLNHLVYFLRPRGFP